jgi:hypothetical protein
MFADWSVLMGADDPVVVVPWIDESGGASYAELRGAPENLAEIVEAQAHPALAKVLSAWNVAGLPWRTLKCDAFALDEETLAALALEMDCDPAASIAGFGSYIDIAFTSPQIFSAFAMHEPLLRALKSAAEEIECPLAAAEFILRRCMLLEDGGEGFAISVYVSGVGAESNTGYANWSLALSALARPLLRVAEQAAQFLPPPVS